MDRLRPRQGGESYLNVPVGWYGHAGVNLRACPVLVVLRPRAVTCPADPRATSDTTVLYRGPVGGHT